MTLPFPSQGLKWILACGLSWLFCACGLGPDLPEEVETAYLQLPARIDYNFHVKPILSDKCFACHGPDQQNRKAGLRLDTREGAMALLEEGGQAIVAGKAEKSEVFRRILSDDPEIVMPTPESHLSLAPAEIATLVKWIEEGAEYKPHWSLIPVTQPSLPYRKNSEAPDQEIDQFVFAKLQAKGLSFSSPAAKAKLIRRASFDLRGLPPTLAEIDAFLQDSSANAYEKVLDQFLASPAYGERMAANWMDIARYADSDGYLDDKHRDFSPYRDWVIKAFNENQSYKEFVSWQLAGDLIPDKTQESVLATAFNRLHKKNSEAGIVFEEYRVENVADRTNTFGKAFLGLSVECARCHDHKYDPISQKEYFQLFAFFNSTDEFGSAVYGPGQTPGPALLLTDEITRAHLDSLRAYIAHLEEERRSILDKAPENEAALSPAKLKASLKRKLLAHYDFEALSPSRDQKFGIKEAKGRAEPIYFNGKPDIRAAGYQGNAFFIKEYNSGRGPKGLGWFDRTDPFSIQFALYPDTLYDEAYFMWHSEERRLGFKGYNFALDSNRLRFFISHSWPQNAIDVLTEATLPIHKWTHISMTYDGSSRASGIKIYLDGQEVEVEVKRDHLYKSILFEPDIHTYGFHNLQMGFQSREKVLTNGGIDELKVYQGTLSPPEVAASLDISLTQIKGKIKWAYDYWQRDPDFQEREAQLNQARRAENDFISKIPEIMVMGDLPQPRPTYILNRGVYNEHGEGVEPETPAAIFPLVDKLRPDRLGLAQWLFDPQNPLTARVYVNRIWMMHFGRGIVKTVEDFGNQGSLPSHPDLLDWLAWDFMQNGWDIKRLHKQIMLSTTYCQSSVISPEALEQDPENVWLARGASFRLPAEMIRDNALAISGLLETQTGGPAAYPYQPKGIWESLTTKHWAYRYPYDTDKGIYRRSLYTIWKRQAPPPAMQLLDIANRDICSVRRQVTNTPLQALTLLNDPQFVEASRKLAETVIAEISQPQEQLLYVFRLCTSRMPTEKEMRTLLDFYKNERRKYASDPTKALAYLEVGKSKWDPALDPAEIAALGVVSNAILNTDEAIVRR
ncbi:MAG: DUF1553 domain-containing protein [Bacteroidota bacterium]